MKKTKSAKPAPSKAASTPIRHARPGRPARIDVHAVTEAAISIGLDKVTLKQVADKLGVAIPSLYRHVKSSDDLVRLAAIELAMRQQPPVQTGAHWSVLATNHAEMLYKLFASEPQLISEMIKGNLGVDLEIEILDHFLTSVAGQGFKVDEAIHLYRSIGIIVVGAAAGALAISAKGDSKQNRRQLTARALKQRPKDQLPYIRENLAAVLTFNAASWRQTLRTQLAGIAASRGEVLPPEPK